MELQSSLSFHNHQRSFLNALFLLHKQTHFGVQDTAALILVVLNLTCCPPSTNSLTIIPTKTWGCCTAWLVEKYPRRSYVQEHKSPPLLLHYMIIKLFSTLSLL